MVLVRRNEDDVTSLHRPFPFVADEGAFTLQDEHLVFVVVIVKRGTLGIGLCLHDSHVEVGRTIVVRYDQRMTTPSLIFSPSTSL